jgi:hypothetical protein
MALLVGGIKDARSAPATPVEILDAARQQCTDSAWPCEGRSCLRRPASHQLQRPGDPVAEDIEPVPEGWPSGGL